MTEELKARIAQINAGTAPAGYKKTKVGIVPEEWEVQKTKKVCSAIIAGATPSTGVAEYWNGTIQWMSSGEINKKVITGTDTRITQAGYDSCSTKMIPKHCVLMALAGQGKTRGMVAYNTVSVCTNQSLAALIPESVDYLFLYYYFDTQYTNLRKLSSGDGTRGGLNLDLISNYYVPLPPLPEQQKIAEILTAQDAVIALLQKRIELKQQQKKALMQKLLSGELRVGDGEWITVKLGKLFSERSEQHCESLELLAITGKYGVIPRSQLDTKDNSSEDKSKYLKICKGDIGYNTMRMWQGVSAYSNYTGIVSPAYTILVPAEQIDALYFAYLFKTPKLISLFYRFSQGLVDDTRSLKYQNFKQISVRFPKEKTEQRKIAEILSAQDNEIELLQLQLALEQQKKKALMQLLLTGKVRVKT